MAALPAAQDFLIGASRTAAEILHQQMVLNAVQDAGEQWAAEAGNAAALRTYTEARAEAQTAAAYRAIGRQAETWVPLLRIVFECLYVGAFPLAVLLMLTPAGLTIFRSYVTGLIWLQSWGPLYAVLHRISMGEAAERMQAAALMPGGDIGISLVAQAGIRAVAADVAVMSGYLSMSIPFLAAALAYGLSKATVLATSVLAIGQDAATSAAHEGTTGNPSLANTQWDTHRFASQEGRQLRTSMHVDTDRYTGYAPVGAAFTVTPDGTAVADMGGATSRVPAAGVRLSESLAVSHEERAAEARSLAMMAEAAADVAEGTAPDTAGAANARAAATAARAAATAAKAAHDAITDDMTKAEADAQAAAAATQAGIANEQYAAAQSANDAIQTAHGINAEQRRVQAIADARMYGGASVANAKKAADDAKAAADAAKAASDDANAAYMKAVSARTDSVNAKKHADAAMTAYTAAKAASDAAYMAAKAAVDGVMDDSTTEQANAARMTAQTEAGKAVASKAKATTQQTAAEGALAKANTSAGTQVLGLLKAANDTGETNATTRATAIKEVADDMATAATQVRSQLRVDSRGGENARASVTATWNANVPANLDATPPVEPAEEPALHLPDVPFPGANILRP